MVAFFWYSGSMKKPKRSTLYKKLDKLVSIKVKERDNETCQWCGKKLESQNCHTSHVITRKNIALRWDLNNLKVLCFYCHIQRWHKSPLEATKWFKNKFPDRYEYLMREKNKIAKFSITDLQEMIKKLT